MKTNINNLLSNFNSLNLNTQQYIEIYKIIKTDKNINITKNNNGVFIDLQNLDPIVFKKLEEFIYYISTNELSKNNI
tara:strand:- start:1089 stop:1319 length:231 start_codon:yes stop_codon:yes gene_type:complete